MFDFFRPGQATRIGRLVNEMRKKTANELLARRAKDLVRRWRDMVARPPTENGTGGSGQGPGGPAPANHHRLMVTSSISRTSYLEIAPSPTGFGFSSFQYWNIGFCLEHLTARSCRFLAEGTLI